jgi:transposase-like protein
MQREVAQELHNIFHAPDLATAQTWLNEMVKKYQSKNIKLAEWLELNVPEGLTFFSKVSSIPQWLE